MKNTLMWILCLTSVLFLGGCLDVDSTRVRYDLDRNLRGNITLEFKGIHAETEKEMQDFYSDYQENATDLVREWGIENPEVTLENSTESRCDGRITGEMESFLHSLEPLLEDADYEISRTETSLAVHIKPRKKPSEPIVLDLHFNGKVIRSNSPVRHQPDGLLEWDFAKLDEKGIEFVLDLDQQSESGRRE